MVEQVAGDAETPRTLDDLLHSLNNCLSAIRSGCIVIEDALDAGDTDEIRRCIAEMRERTQKAFRLSRAVPVFVTAAREE